MAGRPPTARMLLGCLSAAWLLLAVPILSGQQNNPLLNVNRATEARKAALSIIEDLERAPEMPLTEEDRSHHAWKLDFEKRIYEWQFKTSKFVFGMVVFMVGCGMYFSWMHFRASLNPPRRRAKQKDKSDAGEAPPIAPEITQFEAFGVKVSSPIFGVVILTMSFAFFYLYLSIVYPIQ